MSDVERDGKYWKCGFCGKSGFTTRESAQRHYNATHKVHPL